MALLLLSMALVGIGFNVKMLAAFVVLPVFALVYFAGAPLGWRRRLVHLIAGGLVAAVVSLAWVMFSIPPRTSARTATRAWW